MIMERPCIPSARVLAPDPRNLDSPHAGRCFRLYIALTSKCNRECPFCSMHASPRGGCFIDPAAIERHVPASGPYAVQLEGGEPFLHPRFREIVARFGTDDRCERVIISTNGTFFPVVMRDASIDQASTITSMNAFVRSFPGRTTFKVSLNQHLLERDAHLFEKATCFMCACNDAGIDVIFNLRKRPGVPDKDAWLEALVDSHGLRSNTNAFFLQAYGRNAGDPAAAPPFIVGTNWTGVNPDGRAWGTDLLARSEAMKEVS